jgi:cytochrome c oxidase subunit IV
MTTYIRHPLTQVWAFLAVITLASLWVASRHGLEFHTDAAVTASVLLIAAIKTQLVIRYFMEVRFAPAWLKASTYGLVTLIYVLLLAFYFGRL